MTTKEKFITFGFNWAGGLTQPAVNYTFVGYYQGSSLAFQYWIKKTPIIALFTLDELIEMLNNDTITINE